MPVANEDHGRVPVPPAGRLSGCGDKQLDFGSGQVLAYWRRNDTWRRLEGERVFHGLLAFLGETAEYMSISSPVGRGQNLYLFGLLTERPSLAVIRIIQ